DYTTMTGDTGFFAQDIGKLAFIPNVGALGWGNLYKLGDVTPTWAWLGGDPFRFDGPGIDIMHYAITKNGLMELDIDNSSSGSNASAGLRIHGGTSDATFAVYTATSGAGVPNSLTIGNTNGPIVLNPGSGGVQINGVKLADVLTNSSTATQTGFAS